jgi:hypothetical protein
VLEDQVGGVLSCRDSQRLQAIVVGIGYGYVALPGAPHLVFEMCTVSWEKRGYQDLLSLEQNAFGGVR